ncbi:MAG: hypothetical protein MHM6MM_006581 [Cercozoa sp. M6MM]
MLQVAVALLSLCAVRSAAAALSLTRPSTFVDTSAPTAARGFYFCVGSGENTCGGGTTAPTAFETDTSFFQLLTNDAQSTHLMSQPNPFWAQVFDTTVPFGFLLRETDLECRCGRSNTGLEATVTYVNSSSIMHVVFPDEANTGSCVPDYDMKVLVTCYGKTATNTAVNFQYATTTLFASQVDKAVGEWETAITAAVNGYASQSDFDALNSTVVSLNSTVSGLDISSVTSDITSVNNSLNALSSTVSTLSSDTTSNINSLNTTLGTVSDNLSSVNSSVNSLSSTVSGLSSDINSLNSSLQNLGASVSSMLDDTSSNIDSLNSTLNSLSSTVSTLSTDTSSNIDSLNSTLNSLSSGVSDNENNLNTVNSTLSAVVATHTSSIESLNASLSGLQGGSNDTAVNDRIDSLNVSVGSNSDSTAQLQAQVAALNATVALLDARLSLLEATNTTQDDTPNRGLTDSAAAASYGLSLLVGFGLTLMQQY